MSSTNLTKLIEIKGIGKAVSEKLVNYFGSEQRALEAIEQLEVNELAQIEGIGENGAIRIIRSAYAVRTDERIEDFLRTQDIHAIYENILKLFQQRSWTSLTKAKTLIRLVPLPKTQFERLIIRQKQHQSYVELYTLLFPYLNDLQPSFTALKPLKNSTPKLDIVDRVICTDIPEVKTVLNKLKIDQLVHVELLASLDKLQSFIDAGHEVILFSDSEWLGNDSDTYVIAKDLKHPWVEFVPEKILTFYSANKQTLTSIVKITERLSSLIPEHFQQLAPELKRADLSEKLKILGKNLEWLEGDGINEGADPELKRLSAILSKFNSVISILTEEINEKLQVRVEQMQIQLEGKKILEILQSTGLEGMGTANLRDYLDDTLFELIEQLATKTEEQIVEKLSLTSDEAEFFAGTLVPRELIYPVEFNDEPIEKFKQYIRTKKNVHSFQIKRSIAQAFESFQPWIKNLASELFEIDYMLMIGRIFTELKLTWPTLNHERTGWNIINGRNLFLQEELNSRSKQVVPVSYQGGDIADVHKERIILLSGANSGGKTTLLTLLAQVVLLAQMGMGVPAESGRIGCVDEIYYYRKPTGTMDAGAFETALKTFSSMLLDQKKSKCVFADEMEAISEPEASAKVISAILDLLHEQEQTNGVFVSHLANEIAKMSQHLYV